MICKLGIMSLFLPQGCIFEGLGAIVDIGFWVLLVNVTELVPCSDILGEVDPDCSQHLGFQRNGNQGKWFSFFAQRKKRDLLPFWLLLFAVIWEAIKTTHTKNLNETNNSFLSGAGNSWIRANQGETV